MNGGVYLLSGMADWIKQQGLVGWNLLVHCWGVRYVFEIYHVACQYACFRKTVFLFESKLNLRFFIYVTTVRDMYGRDSTSCTFTRVDIPPCSKKMWPHGEVSWIIWPGKGWVTCNLWILLGCGQIIGDYCIPKKVSERFSHWNLKTHAHRRFWHLSIHKLFLLYLLFI